MEPTPCDTGAAQSFLNGSIYDQTRVNLLHGRETFYVYKPSGATGDFIAALGYVREALLAAGWLNSFTITMVSGPLEYAYFSMKNEQTTVNDEAKIHSIFHVHNTQSGQAIVLALDIPVPLLDKLVNGDSQALESLISRAHPLMYRQALGLDMVHEIPNGDKIFYVSTLRL